MGSNEIIMTEIDLKWSKNMKSDEELSKYNLRVSLIIKF